MAFGYSKLTTEDGAVLSHARSVIGFVVSQAIYTPYLPSDIALVWSTTTALDTV